MNILTKKTDNEVWIAHYGGSFNPIHNGHIAVAEELVDQYGFDKVCFVPNGDAYRKSGLAPASDRFSLVENAVSGNPAFEVFDWELESEVAVRTIETLKQLHEMLSDQYDSFRLFTVRGDDSVNRIRNWKSLPEMLEISELIIVTREIADIEKITGLVDKLPGGGDRVHILSDVQNIPDISSTDIRNSIICENRNSEHLPEGALGIMQQLGMYGMKAPGDEWVDLSRPGYSGGNKYKQDALRQQFFGENNWRTAFCWGEQVITYNSALQLYEDAYLEHFEKNPDILEWLINTAYDVYDNAESNVFSEHDYSIQEARTTHLQDISIRRCMMRMGKEFKGNHLLEIRDKNSEGYCLNPGQVPFHKPEMINQPEPESWWLPGSIESFWQANKVFQVKEKVFTEEKALNMHLLIQKEDQYLCQQQESQDIYNELPVIRFGKGRSFKESVTDSLHEFGLAATDLSATFAEPAVSEDGLHVVMQVNVVPDKYPANCAWIGKNKFKAKLRNKTLAKQLKKVL